MDLTNSIITWIAGGGGSLFLAIISLLIKLITKKIGKNRYQAAKTYLEGVTKKIEETNTKGNESLKEKFMKLSEAMQELAQGV